MFDDNLVDTVKNHIFMNFKSVPQIVYDHIITIPLLCISIHHIIIFIITMIL